jgi:hypothetical protein
MIAWCLIMRNIAIEMYQGVNKHYKKGFVLRKQFIIDSKKVKKETGNEY